MRWEGEQTRTHRPTGARQDDLSTGVEHAQDGSRYSHVPNSIGGQPGPNNQSESQRAKPVGPGSQIFAVMGQPLKSKVGASTVFQRN